MTQESPSCHRPIDATETSQDSGLITVGDDGVWSLSENSLKNMDAKSNLALAPVRHASSLSGYTILTKSMIGSGIFVMAYGCSKFGIVLASVMILLAASITWISLRILSILAIEFKDTQPTFYSISHKILPNLRWIIDVSVILNCLGASTGYVITAGEMLSTGIYGIFSVDADSQLSVRYAKIIIQCCMVFALAPLCIMKEISGTKVANLVGLTCLAYIVIMTFVYTKVEQISSELIYPSNFLSAMGAFPTFIFAFACQMNVTQIANELKNPTVKRMNIISVAATLTGLMVYVPIMILPYISFGKEIKDNYLRNFGPDKVPVQVAYILAAISVSISYVLQVHPLRRSLLTLYFGNRNPSLAEEKRNRIIVVGIILLATLGIAIGLDKIDIVTNFTGLLGGNTMCFFMPSLLYLKHYGIKRTWFGFAVCAVFLLSVALYPLCLTGIIYDMVNTN